MLVASYSPAVGTQCSIGGYLGEVAYAESNEMDITLYDSQALIPEKGKVEIEGREFNYEKLRRHEEILQIYVEMGN